ncbi:IucA/IucC family protein [Metabacillus arenae]|uniref:IucA/IucC family siderophore biosynthesis protein n=1 Tax=Metabacillus arenae TaxID=2771434 RepID=A0A926NBQ4_9BACI|nr:IucA/IucC family siderophore biosynthesis protein [Metabacillus arenae]MBD1380564.1 IucA/IucC family siderophore biosynthesis protein [Metabacillus arenae]
MFLKEELEQVLDKERWKEVNQKLLAKMLAEYMYEDMIHPEKDGNVYVLEINEEKFYRFHAEERLFDSYDVKVDSIEVYEEGKWVEADRAIDFLLDIKPLIGMSPDTTGHLIRELNHTLLADLHLLENAKKTSDELVDVDYAELEGEMTGHPWITYNKGRIGFGYDDYLRFAPEQQKLVKLYWIAVHKSRSTFSTVNGLNYNKVLSDELDHGTIEKFTDLLAGKRLIADDYYFIPVHEWQWKNHLIQNFVEDLAMELIVPLGEGEDLYLPQQSIRTFVNVSSKGKHHVKLPMSILNTLVYRGLPSERTLIAPKITEHIKGIAEKDVFLKETCKVILPGEIASANVDQRHYQRLDQAPYQYLEMLGCIWRESIYTYLEEGENHVTLAALLYEDKKGKPFVKSLIEKSGLSADEWIKTLFNVVMPPLLHYLYQYGTVFSPHGQNTILVLKDYKPHRLAIKDFVDDVNISDQPFPELEALTEDLKKVLRSEPPEGLTQFIFTGLFICHLRYLSSIMVNQDLLDETRFWELLSQSIKDYQKAFPHLEERFKLFDFFKPQLTKLCLNRNRMVDYGYGDDDDRPHASEFGKVNNALAGFREQPV